MVSAPCRAGVKCPANLTNKNTMTDTNNNDGQSFELCVVNQPELKFSEVKKAMAEHRLKMDEPGMLVASDEEDSYCWFEEEGASKMGGDVFRLTVGAFGRLLTAMFGADPEAWGVVATWAAKNWRARHKKKELAELLVCIANN